MRIRLGRTNIVDQLVLVMHELQNFFKINVPLSLTASFEKVESSLKFTNFLAANDNLMRMAEGMIPGPGEYMSQAIQTKFPTVFINDIQDILQLILNSEDDPALTPATKERILFMHALVTALEETLKNPNKIEEYRGAVKKFCEEMTPVLVNGEVTAKDYNLLLEKIEETCRKNWREDRHAISPETLMKSLDDVRNIPVWLTFNAKEIQDCVEFEYAVKYLDRTERSTTWKNIHLDKMRVTDMNNLEVLFQQFWMDRLPSDCQDVFQKFGEIESTVPKQ